MTRATSTERTTVRTAAAHGASHSTSHGTAHGTTHGASVAPPDAPHGTPDDRAAPQRLSPLERIVGVADEGSFERWDEGLLCSPPFSFSHYEERLVREREKTGCAEAVCCGRATIRGCPVAVVSMNPFFLMGSMGSTVGERITRAIERAAEHRLPLIVFSASGGARMQEGLASLLQMAKISCALARYAERGLPYFSVMTDPTTGGVMAALSSQGDIIIVEKGAQIGFTGRRVIETTFRPQFPADFQNAEFALTHGLVDTAVERGELRDLLSRLLALHEHQTREPRKPMLRAETAARLAPPDKVSNAASPDKPRSAWERVCLARKMNRPTAQSYIARIISDFVELRGDRGFGDDPAIIAGIGRVGALPVSVIAQEKGTDTLERVRRNFGMPHPEGYRKVIRLARQAEKFNRPIICFVDTQGAHCGVESEERGQGNAIGDCLMTMATLRVPVISVILGEGGSGGALALALANSIGMMENAIYSICSPEAFATILWKESSRAAEASELMHLTARDALEIAAIDEIIPEPPSGAQANPDHAAEAVGRFLIQELERLASMDADLLVKERQRRFRDFLRIEEGSAHESHILDFRIPTQAKDEFSVNESFG
jgi:acetyl-CoA carboxylase carboxyl transferase subunit beta